MLTDKEYIESVHEVIERSLFEWKDSYEVEHWLFYSNLELFTHCYASAFIEGMKFKNGEIQRNLSNIYPSKKGVQLLSGLCFGIGVTFVVAILFDLI